jgi:hypothetical protein
LAKNFWEIDSNPKIISIDWNSNKGEYIGEDEQIELDKIVENMVFESRT